MSPDPTTRLTPELLLHMYRRGYFPMAESRESRAPLQWFTAVRRGVIPVDPVRLPRRLRDRLRSSRFVITSNRAFTEVVLGCAEPREDERETWINGEIVAAYTELHRGGWAHSVEAWHSGTGKLVGGIYGVQVGGVFSAESKFCRPAEGGTDASKVCLAHLALHLRRRGFAVLDAQIWNPHLAQFGCVEMPRAEYLALLQREAGREVAWEPFDAEANLVLLAGA
jgi:leucyl/phenylalanyl-tRNA---protein transferase